MRKQSFGDWLLREVAASRMALIAAYETRDRLLYVEAPPIRKRYMEAIGTVEEGVLRAELEESLLRRKAELIQIALNRREPVDPAAIDAQLEAEKKARIAAMERDELTLNELPQLSPQQAQTLQKQYREIIRNFQPAMNPDTSDTQKELYQKALEAYKMQDADAMQLIHDMLLAPLNMDGVLLPEPIQPKDTAEEQRELFRSIADELATDYTLVKELYDCFVPMEEDRIIQNALESYEAQRQAVMTEITAIRGGFPFNALETLNDPAKTQEYLMELRIRAKRCEEEKTRLERKIAELTEGTSHG